VLDMVRAARKSPRPRKSDEAIANAPDGDLGDGLG
jgi:hypothetical protein